MQCWVYKGTRKTNTYLYVTAKDDFSRVPAAVLELMGALTFVLDIDLSTRDKLAQSDIREVGSKLAQQGFYIQLPPGDYADPFDAAAAT